MGLRVKNTKENKLKPKDSKEKVTNWKCLCAEIRNILESNKDFPVCYRCKFCEPIIQSESVSCQVSSVLFYIQ